jgi:hypothetical protein
MNSIEIAKEIVSHGGSCSHLLSGECVNCSKICYEEELDKLVGDSFFKMKLQLAKEYLSNKINEILDD